MKLLSIGGYSHDTNITYFDGDNTHYLKLERILDSKHFGLKKINVDLCVTFFNSIFSKYWNTSFQNMDEIVVVDSLLYQLLLDTGVNKNITSINHHLAHALSVCFMHDVDKNIVLDGSGPQYRDSADRLVNDCWHVYFGDELITKGIVQDYGSIGHGITYISYLFDELSNTGRPIDRPGKLMGLQSYGNIDYEYLEVLQKYNIYNVNALYRKRVSGGDTLFNMDNYLNFLNTQSLSKQQKLNWVRTVHERTGEIVLELFDKFVSPNDRVGYSGGVAQNVIWNTLLKNKYPNLVVVPYCGDEGLSIGAMEMLRRKYNLPKMKLKNFPFSTTDEAPKDSLGMENVKIVAKHLADGAVVALYQGNGEIGPRALGNRSILFDPRIPNGKDIINQIKNREYFRPFGASVLEEHKDSFGLTYKNPYMLYVGEPKISVPSITHVDGTCRVQTVSENGTALRSILEEFYKITGCPALLNTSLNVSGKPIAGKIASAEEEFSSKSIDILVVGNKIYY
jgi:carbamoyltransferase